MISAVLAVRDGERFLAEALASVLAQTHPVDEIVVVDDGSVDRTAEVAAAGGARVVRQANAGQAAAINAGVAAARGDLLAFLDHDDLWEPDKTARQLAVLDADVDAVYGHTVEFREPDAPPGVKARPGARPAPLPGAMLIRRAAFERVGGFDVAAGRVAVVDFHARVLEAGLRTVMLPDVVYRRRLHAHNSGVRDPEPTAYLAALRAVLRRRSG